MRYAPAEWALMGKFLSAASPKPKTPKEIPPPPVNGFNGTQITQQSVVRESVQAG
jgi:hypothetical protein